MNPHLAFDGLEPTAALEAAVQRWVSRLETKQSLATCDVEIHIEPCLWGFGKRARVAVVVASDRDDLEEIRSARFRDHADLYLLIADVFRAIHHRLAGAVGHAAALQRA